VVAAKTKSRHLHGLRRQRQVFQDSGGEGRRGWIKRSLSIYRSGTDWYVRGAHYRERTLAMREFGGGKLLFTVAHRKAREQTSDRYREILLHIGKRKHLINLRESESLHHEICCSVSQGFFLTVSPESIQTVARHAYENDKMFMMNLSAPFLCEFFQKPMLAAFPYVDILFGNETEADAFAKANNLNATDRRQIALKISEMEKINNRRKRIVVITQGAETVLLAKDGTVTEYPVVKLPEEKVVDTNAAGDAFVGGEYESPAAVTANICG